MKTGLHRLSPALNRLSPAFTSAENRICTPGTHGREEAVEAPLSHIKPSRPADAREFCVRELAGSASQTTFRPQSPAAPSSCPKGSSRLL